MNENQQKQILEITHTYCHNQTNLKIIIHTIFREIKDKINNFGRFLETIKMITKQKIKNTKYIINEIKNSIDRSNNRLFRAGEKKLSEKITRMKDRETNRVYRRKVKRHRRYSEMF